MDIFFPLKINILGLYGIKKGANDKGYVKITLKITLFK